MYITAEKFGFNKLKLAQAGATATNIVLAKISSINTFIESLCEIGLSSAI